MAKFDISIIVVAWNVKELLIECFDALRASTDSLNKQILLVDNGSVDGSADFIEQTYPEVTVIRSPTNLGFIRANNLAYEQAEGEYILMLNSDAFVFPDSLQTVYDFMENNPECGVTGARLIGRDGILQPSARYFPTPFKLFLQKCGLDGKLPLIGPLDDLSWNHQTVKECDWVVGCFLLTRKNLIEQMGFFLREDYFMYNDDNDLCLRIKRLGYKVFFVPADVIHVGGANVIKMKQTKRADNQVLEYQMESQFIYFRKNYSKTKVLANWLFLQIFNAMIWVKSLVTFRFKRMREEIKPDIRLANKVLRETRFGESSIH